MKRIALLLLGLVSLPSAKASGVLPEPNHVLTQEEPKGAQVTTGQVVPETPGVGDLISPTKLGQAIMGMIIGMGLGGIAAETSMTTSGGVPDAQATIGNLWSGAVAGALVAYRLDPKHGMNEHAGVGERTRNALFNGFWTGLMGGVMGGSLVELGSGSSREGGVSASSASSSSSFGDEKTEFRNGRVDQLALSGNVPLIHAALAGAVGGAGVAYLEPEIHTFAEMLGGAILKAAASLHKTAKNVHKHFAGLKRANICFAKDDENPNEDAVALKCEGDYMIQKIEPAPYSFETEDERVQIKQFFQELNCEKQQECKVPQCGAHECPVPGCEYQDEETKTVREKYVTYECVEGTKQIQVCHPSANAAELRLSCPDGLVLKDIKPDQGAYDAPDIEQEALAFIAEIGCSGLPECTLPACEVDSCPVPGCVANSDQKRQFLYDCANGPRRVQVCFGREESSKSTVTVFESMGKITQVDPDLKLELETQEMLKALAKHCIGKHECKMPRCEADSCEIPGCKYGEENGEKVLSEVFLMFHTEEE